MQTSITNATNFNAEIIASTTSQQRGWSSVLKALLLGVPQDNGFRQASNRASVFSAAHWVLRFPLWCELWRVFRSLPYRILETHEKGLVQRGVDTKGLTKNLGVEGFASWSNSEFRSRIQDIQSPQRSRPWTTYLDEQIFLEGYLAGIACLSRTGSMSVQQEASECLTMAARTSVNPTPGLTVQQSC